MYYIKYLRCAFGGKNYPQGGNIMQRQKKTRTLHTAFFVMTALLFFASALSAADREPWWWMEEIAPPPEGQIINPDYINKREELAQFWAQFNRDRKFSKQYWLWTNRWEVKYDNTRRSYSTAEELESELAKIPVYIPKPSDQGSGPSVPAQP